MDTQAMRVDETAGDTIDATGPAGGAGRRRLFARRDESGLVFVWTTLFLLVLLGFAALAVDLGHAYFVGEREQNAVDAAALAGAPYLPGDPVTAHDAALQLAAANGFTDGQDGVNVAAAPSPDDPSQLVVTITQNVPTWFGGAIGFHNMTVGKTGVGVANSSASATPLDMMLILDRTYSMSKEDLAQVRTASKALLKTLNPKVDTIALGVTGPSVSTALCTGGGNGIGVGPTNTPGSSYLASPWPAAAPATDYQMADGSVNTSSQIVQTIDCLTTSQSSTNLGDPIAAAQQYFSTYGRPGVPKGIILMTDGAANRPTGSQPCDYANGYASQAKAAGIEIVTIGFGLDDLTDKANFCTDTSGPFQGAPDSTGQYHGAFATNLLASMASPVNNVPADNNGCTAAENDDGDDFFCVSKESTDLSRVFVIAAGNLVDGAPRLIK